MEDLEDILRRGAWQLSSLCTKLSTERRIEKILGYTALLCNIQAQSILQKIILNNKISGQEEHHLLVFQTIAAICCKVMTPTNSINVILARARLARSKSDEFQKVFDDQLYEIFSEGYSYYHLLRTIDLLYNPLHIFLSLQEVAKERGIALPQADEEPPRGHAGSSETLPIEDLEPPERTQKKPEYAKEEPELSEDEPERCERCEEYLDEIEDLEDELGKTEDKLNRIRDELYGKYSTNKGNQKVYDPERARLIECVDRVTYIAGSGLVEKYQADDQKSAVARVVRLSEVCKDVDKYMREIICALGDLRDELLVPPTA